MHSWRSSKIASHTSGYVQQVARFVITNVITTHIYYDTYDATSVYRFEQVNKLDLS